MIENDPKKIYSAQSFADVDVTKSSRDRRSNVRLSKRATQIAESLQNEGISPNVLTAFIRTIDFLIVFLVGLLSHWVVGFSNFPEVSLTQAIVSIVASILCVLTFQALDCYKVQTLRKLIRQIGCVVGGGFVVFSFLEVIASVVLDGHNLSTPWINLWTIYALIALACFHLILNMMVTHWTKAGKLERRAIIVGGGQRASELINSLEASPDNDIRICGIFDDRNDARSPSNIASYQKLGNIAELVEFGRKTRIDMLIVTLPITAEKRVLQLLKQLWVLPVDIRLAAHADNLLFRSRSYSYIGGTAYLDIFKKPIADIDSVIKRASDIVLSLFFIILLSPIMLLAALAVRLESKGPIIFRQRRHGFNNEIIEVLKFRSMYHEMADPDAKNYVTKGDPRVTKVGRFIRKTSIDELPQFFNVLYGNLSLVGPRPHAITAHMHNTPYADVVDNYYARHRVKPGVTGWAQVNGLRGEIDRAEKIQQRVEYDLYYIENWSLLLDLYIVMITPFKLLFDTENAY